MFLCICESAAIQHDDTFSYILVNQRRYNMMHFLGYIFYCIFTQSLSICSQAEINKIFSHFSKILSIITYLGFSSPFDYITKPF